jgi:two-component system, LytTR family, response regulator
MHNMQKYRAVIVEDEELAAQELKFMLESYAFVEIVEIFNQSSLAVKKIEELSPDLIFLDIQMPILNGFEMLEKLGVVPEVVFVTAFDEYALKAFEVNALDYLLKPISKMRLDVTMQRIKKKWELRLAGEQDKKLFIKSGNEWMFLSVHDIEWAESVGNYVRIHSIKGTSILHRTLQSFHEISSENEFFRNNKSEIFNIRYIDKVISESSKLLVKLKSGKELDFSQRQAVKFKQLFEKNSQL